jgi:SAM-dependent methyltransferase
MLQPVKQAQFSERTKCINCSSPLLKELSAGRYHDEPLRGFLAADPADVDPLPHLNDATWILVQCEDCQLVFHERILNEEWNEIRFSEWMNANSILEFEARLGPQFSRSFERGKRHVEHILRIEKLTRNLRATSNPVRLLDFGCGFGSFLEACVHFGFNVAGVDRSTARRERANMKILSSLDDFQGETFHAVTLFETLEHLDHTADVLGQLSGFLPIGGILVLETPDAADVTDVRTQHDYLMAHPLEHINCFTFGTLKSIAERHGFALITRGPAFVTSEYHRAAKRLARHALQQDMRSTQLYSEGPSPSQRRPHAAQR